MPTDSFFWKPGTAEQINTGFYGCELLDPVRRGNTELSQLTAFWRYWLTPYDSDAKASRAGYPIYIMADDGRISLTEGTLDGIPLGGTPAGGFLDVQPEDYYAEAVQWAVEAGITNGVGSGLFGAGEAVTRSQAVTFLWRAAGQPQPQSPASPFSDVTDPAAWYYSAVLWAAERGITRGSGEGRFGTEDTLSYEQMLAFLARAAGADASGADWSERSRAWAEEVGLTEGLTFSAKADCPRADVVYCLWKELRQSGAA